MSRNALKIDPNTVPRLSPSLAVPERPTTIWLQVGRYVESESSPTFPSIAIIEIIPRFMQRAREVGFSQALEEFEAFIGSSDR